jgi:hypothetical protein
MGGSEVEMAVGYRAITAMWLPLLCWTPAHSAVNSLNAAPELANIPELHGVALFYHPVLAEESVMGLCYSGYRDSLRKEVHPNCDQQSKMGDLLTKAFERSDEVSRGAYRSEKNLPPGADRLERIYEPGATVLLEGLPKILTKPQMTRFEQLHCQIEGLASLRFKVYASRVGLSDNQRKRIRALHFKYATAAKVHHRAVFTARSMNEVPLHTVQLISLAKFLDLKILDLLTAKQRTAWLSLVGERFDWNEDMSSKKAETQDHSN